MSNAGSVMVKLGVDSGSMDSDLAKAKTKMERFSVSAGKRATTAGAGGLGAGGMAGMIGGPMVAAASAAAAAVVAFGKSVLGMAGDLADAADNMDISVERLQTLQQFFGEAGVKSQKFAKSMATLSGSIEAAKSGDEDAIENFKRLGVTFDDLATLAPDELLSSISDKAAQAADKGKLLADLTKVLGKGAKDMVGPLSQGSAAIDQVGASMTKMSEENVKALDSLGDDLSRTWESMKAGAGNTAGFITRAFKHASAEVSGKGGVKSPFETAAPVDASVKKRDDAAKKDLARDQRFEEARSKFVKDRMDEEEKTRIKTHEDAMRAKDELVEKEKKVSMGLMTSRQKQAAMASDIEHLRSKEGLPGGVGMQFGAEAGAQRLDLIAEKTRRNLMTAQERRDEDREMRRQQRAASRAERAVAAREGRNVAMGIQPPDAKMDAASKIDNAGTKFAAAVDTFANTKFMALQNV